MTIKQSFNFQEFMISKTTYEELFDQDDLDYKQPQEAVFITDTADLIAIDNENNFQVLAQTDLQTVCNGTMCIYVTNNM
jgi:hypothetical protein